MGAYAKLRSLDGIRGLAVMFVFLSHASQRGAGPVEWLRFDGIGHVGVYLFFSLSAFLLTLRLVSGQGLGEYFIHRFFRIAPLYYAVVAAVFCYQIYFPADKESLFLNGGAQGLLETLLFYRGDGIFWTIPVEMTFYVLLPVFLFIGGSRPGRLVLLAIVVAYFAWYYAIQAFHFALPHPHFLKVAHLGHFLDVFIMAVAVAIARPPMAARWGGPVFLGLLVLTIILVSYNFLGFHQPWKNMRDLSLLYALVFALGLSAAAQGSPVLDRVFDRSFLRLLGRWSFGIYLLHMPVIALTVALIPDTVPGLRFLCVVLCSLCMARLAHRYIEQPGIALGQRLADAMAVPTAIRQGVVK